MSAYDFERKTIAEPRFYEGPIGAVISSMRVEYLGNHAHIHVWNRGGKAGVLVVNRRDAATVVERLTNIEDDGST